ncbi:MAG TPA: Gfo/Idh/MocA family oxidoreductase [Spirochaetia bacterium]|nr:Gfo/Idh/MocA family oxidoreductase [Spirochaetia bacterium]
MNSKEKVVVGVIGAGKLGASHARIYHELPISELYGVADIKPELAQSIGDKYKCKTFTDYRQMLASKDVQAVSIATPDHLHRQPVIDALEAGKHVLVEKPLAITIEDAGAMREAQKKSGRYLMVNYNNRWAFPYTKIKNLVDAGEIGSPLMTYAKKVNSIKNPTQLLKWADETSCVHFLSTHDIDMIRWYIGEPDAVEVYAAGVKRVLAARGFKTLDGMMAIVKFANGVVSTFESAWILPEKNPSGVEGYIEMIGTEGVLHLDRREELLVYTNDKGGFQSPRVSMGGEVNGQIQGALRWSQEHFIQSILQDKPPVIDAESGYRIVEIACAIHKSIDEGGVVKLPL